MKQINLALEFSEYPAGRYRSDGKYSGQAFREDFLVPALRSGEKVAINLDGAMGYGSSFLEEAFGGLIRDEGFTAQQVLDNLQIISGDDPSLIEEITEYLKQ